MCRAHGIAHQKVVHPSDLAPALRSAWDLNRHSVVEVFTNRLTNVDHHRSIQSAVAAAVLRALHAAALPAQLPGGVPSSQAPPPHAGNGSGSVQSVDMPGGVSRQEGLPDVELRPVLTVREASYERYSLPLQKPLTTGEFVNTVHLFCISLGRDRWRQSQSFISANLCRNLINKALST